MACLLILRFTSLGMLKDDTTIESSKIKDGVKVMLIGSKVEDILKVAASAQTTVEEEKTEGMLQR